MPFKSIFDDVTNWTQKSKSSEMKKINFKPVQYEPLNFV